MFIFAKFVNRVLVFISKTFVITFLLSSQSNAQFDAADELELLYGDEETVSVATGSSKAVRLAPSIATVVTAEDIKAMGANSLEDVLQTIPGIHVSLRNIYASNYSIRGVVTTYTPQVLLLLNGYPFAEAYSGTKISIQKVPIRNVKRVEVIRGPGSAVYGADAFAGVVNIITYDNEDITDTRLGAAVGSFDTAATWFQGKTNISEWELGLFLEWETSEGDDGRVLNSDLQTTFDGIFSTSASNAPGAAATHYKYVNNQIQLSRQQWKVNLNSYYQDDTGLGVGIGDALDPEGNQYFLQHLFEVNFSSEESSSSRWQHEAKVNYFYLKQRSHYTIFPAGSVLPIGSDGNINFVAPAGLVLFSEGFNAVPGGYDKYYSTDYAGFYTGFGSQRIRLATGFRKQFTAVNEQLNFGPGVIDGTQSVVDGTLTDITGTSNIFLPDRDRENYYVSIQDEWAFYKDWEITAGIRYDDYSDFGNTFNPRLALVWQTNYRLTTKFLYGQAFRAPSLSELFVVNNPDILGNPDLEPEQVETVELSFDYRFSYDLKAQFNIFSYQADDLIKFVSDNNTIGSNTAQNSAGQDGHGVEIETQWSINEMIALSANYSWQQSEDKTLEEDVADAPQQLFYAELRWKFRPKWGMSAQLHHVAARPRTGSDSRPELDDYTIVNINLYTNKSFSSWDFNLSVHNLFDEEAFEPGNPNVPIDHPLQGRSVLFGAVYSFE